MIEMTLSSRHRIQNSSPGGLRPSTLPLPTILIVNRHISSYRWICVVRCDTMLDRGCTALQAVGQHGAGIGSGVEWTLASAGTAGPTFNRCWVGDLWTSDIS